MSAQRWRLSATVCQRAPFFIFFVPLPTDLEFFMLFRVPESHKIVDLFTHPSYSGFGPRSSRDAPTTPVRQIRDILPGGDAGRYVCQIAAYPRGGRPEPELLLCPGPGKGLWPGACGRRKSPAGHWAVAWQAGHLRPSGTGRILPGSLKKEGLRAKEQDVGT